MCGAEEFIGCIDVLHHVVVAAVLVRVMHSGISVELRSELVSCEKIIDTQKLQGQMPSHLGGHDVCNVRRLGCLTPVCDTQVTSQSPDWEGSPLRGPGPA